MTPAVTPTECEACADLMATAQFSAARHSRDLHARIRELVEKVRLATYCDFHEPDGTLDCEECEEARAALARSEGGGA